MGRLSCVCCLIPITLSLVLLLGGSLQAAVVLRKASGVVQTRSGSGSWQNVLRLPAALAVGDQVRTGAQARAVLVFEDDSRVELGPDTVFILEDAAPKRMAMRLRMGRMRASVQRLFSRRFEVRTPTAVCSVRGTEFLVHVAAGGRTTVDLYKGLLGVEDSRGHQVLLHPNERIRVDLRGMGAPERAPSAMESVRGIFHAGMRREVALDMSREEVLAAAAKETKLAEYQQGKVLMDVHGERVRLEQYILRPRPDQFKLVVLNDRSGRFDYFYYLGTFNKTLPTDLSSALRQLRGGLDTAPDYYLTSVETGRSNTADSMLELAQGGHLVDVNNNSDFGDDVNEFFDPSADAYVDSTGRSVYQSLFDRYGFYLNGKLKYGWTGSNIQTYDDKILSSNTDPISGVPLNLANAYLDGGILSLRSDPNVTFPTDGKVYQRIYESYGDGSFISWDSYILDDQGRVADSSEFASLTGTALSTRLLDFNYEQVVTATEFGGRKIDLVVSPKILMQSKVIQ
ncbi:MAG: FecR family protein [Elusimicrobiota bacterium]|jgi:hypothetical protein